MNTTRFLNRLKKQGTIRLIEPSRELQEAYIKKSSSYLISAKLLVDNDRLEESVSMAYYSMYYLLQALLFRIGIKCENHTASIILLKEIFGFENSQILFAKKERIDKQYYVDFTVTKDEVIETISVAEEFTAMLLDFLARLQNDHAAEFRLNAERLMRG